LEPAFLEKTSEFDHHSPGEDKEAAAGAEQTVVCRTPFLLAEVRGAGWDLEGTAAKSRQLI
jgi:hypothetical protein